MWFIISAQMSNGISQLPWKSGNTNICAESKHITHMLHVSLSCYLWTPVSCMSLTLSLQHCGDIQDTGEHISACLCPYFSLFNTMWMHRTQVSMSALTHVLY